MDFRDAPVDQAELVRIRRQLHMYPETKWDLPRTTALVREELERSGIFYEADKYGPNTIVATINPQIAAFTIALRADMDALPIQERNEDKAYRSRIPGAMHACGHDAHTAMLLGAAKALHAVRDRLRCRVKLLFQPCEEGRPSGARVMCEHGVMEGVDCVLMCHVNCGDPVHVVSCCSGVTNATSVAFKLSLDGRAVHVASPHCGVDALAAGVNLYNGIQLLVSREVDPFDVCVMSVCTMHAGNTVATNAEHCELEGSIRCLKDDTMRWAMERLARLARLTAEEGGVRWANRCPARTTIPRFTRLSAPARKKSWARSASAACFPRRARKILPIMSNANPACSLAWACETPQRAPAIPLIPATGTSMRTRFPPACRFLCNL